MSDLWENCRDLLIPEWLDDVPVRVVESQEQVATNALVDSLAEQALLEALLEASKPAPHPQAAHLHYLLATPFRYPPLRHGSRFGARHEPGIFYASRERHTALAEAAYYRCVFWQGMTQPPPGGRLLTQHTLFGAAYRSDRGLRLQDEPCARHRAAIADPAHYTATQALGAALRAADIEVFEYPSARDPHGINVAIFTPRVFAQPRPVWQEAWLCETTAARVVYTGKGAGAIGFESTGFLVGGRVPEPAL